VWCDTCDARSVHDIRCYVICGVCASARVRKYFQVRNSPGLQNVLYDSEEAARSAPNSDADFWLCEECLLLFNASFEEQHYSTAYNNDQSSSAVYRAHLLEVADLLKGQLQLDDRIVEIGCGNGALLRQLHEQGYTDLEGYDPAHAGGLEFVKCEYWRSSGQPFDALIIRHALESMADYRGILAAAVADLDKHGMLYLELTNARCIVERAATLNLYHEYPQYFSEIAISRLLEQLGCYVHEIRHFFGDEMLGIVARRKQWHLPGRLNVSKLGKFKNIYIWGISGRTIHFLTNYSIGAETIRYGVDMDPRKQGKYIPGTGQKIVSPEACIAGSPDAVVVLNENYVDEVARRFSKPVTMLTYRDFCP
jgi:2-polyprenyl-3-methyl-5-hydroxy-6-metoxy-1,4-benzoquinol methylase